MKCAFSLLLLVTVTAAATVKVVHNDKVPYDKILGKTDFGSWGTMHRCINGTFVNGFRMKLEAYKGIFGDDSAVNAITFRCSNGEEFSSNIGKRGMWHSWHTCRTGAFIDGVKLRSEGDQGAFEDDMAATGFEVHCSDNQWITGEGIDNVGTQDGYMCDTGYKMCGLQTQVEESVGVDYTGLSKIRVLCC